MKEKLKNIPHRRWMELGICTVLALLLLVWALALELAEPEREATAAQKRQFAVARVLDVLEDMNLDAEQMDKIYDTLENLGIDTVGEDYIPELPDDEPAAASASNILRSRS